MSKVNVGDIEWVKWASPKAKFSSNYKDISIALGEKPDTPVGAGGHPFDLAVEKLAPGEISCPFHSHAAQWELFYITSGSGTVRLAGETQKVRPGDVVLHPPGEAHQITNTGNEELVYFIIADNPPLDVCYYPDSDKWSMYPGKRFLKSVDDEYWDREE